MLFYGSLLTFFIIGVKSKVYILSKCSYVYYFYINILRGFGIDNCSSIPSCVFVKSRVEMISLDLIGLLPFLDNIIILLYNA